MPLARVRRLQHIALSLDLHALPICRIASSFTSQEAPPASDEQLTKKARGSRWGKPIPPPVQPQSSVPAPAPQANSSISRAPPVPFEPSHPRWEPLRGSAGTAAQQQANIAHPSPGGPPAQTPVSSSQPVERVNQEDAMKRVRELAAEFMARASKSAALDQQSDVEEPGASIPPPPPPPLAQWTAPSALSALQASQGGITSAVQPSQMPPAPVPPPGPRPPASVPGVHCLANLLPNTGMPVWSCFISWLTLKLRPVVLLLSRAI